VTLELTQMPTTKPPHWQSRNSAKGWWSRGENEQRQPTATARGSPRAAPWGLGTKPGGQEDGTTATTTERAVRPTGDGGRYTCNPSAPALGGGGGGERGCNGGHSL
jgi:hypothetical protein